MIFVASRAERHQASSVLARLDQSALVPCIAMSAAIAWNGRILCICGGSSVRVLNTQTGESLITMEGHTGEIDCLAVCEKENCLVTGSKDKTAKKWDLKTGQ